ncbi:MAG: M48 family metallopeptidase [Alphaproteobacteria bacterium]|nr:M48 family metallopeptidase [Alphaproteobacteria bacterium]
MALPTAGLQTHIWNNNLKSIALLALYPFLIMGIIWLCAYVVSGSMFTQSIQATYGYSTTFENSAAAGANAFLYAYWPLILSGVAIWFTLAYFFHTKMISKLSHSHPVSRQEEPELYNLLENLSITAGIPMPRLEIIETHARNAFASGIDQKSFSVTVTRGLMTALTKDELEAVLGHELTHILNRDVRLLIITIIFTGMIGFAAQLVWSQIRYGFIYTGRRREGGSGIIIMMALVFTLWLGYVLTLFTRFAISRNREYMADAGAVQLTKNPQAMMSALMRIAGRDHIPQTTDDIAMMCFENAKPFLGLFATHPPIEKRIRALSETTGTPVPTLSMPPADLETRFQRSPNLKNPWLVRDRRPF